MFKKKRELQPADELLAKLGFVHSEFLVGVNEHINKKINVYYHELIPMQSLTSYSFQNNSRQLASGMTLVESNYSFNDCFLRDDIVPDKNSTKTEWNFKKYEPLTRWLAGDEARKRYNTRSFYLSNSTTEMMQLIVNDMYDELMRLTEGNLELARKLIPLLYANGYQSIPVMMEIAKHASNNEITQFVEAIQRTEEMKLSVNDYQLLFDTMDRSL
jgi:hypothetical protein